MFIKKACALLALAGAPESLLTGLRGQNFKRSKNGLLNWSEALDTARSEAVESLLHSHRPAEFTTKAF